jgi:succinate dehydrogenase/fumarate reductase flavoprotein subunit
VAGPGCRATLWPRRAGIVEDIEQPRTYLRHELGEHYDAAMIDAFLENGPRMVAFFEQHTALQFADGNAIADIHGDTPGAGTGGRSVIAAPYDGRKVGKLLKRLRKTMRETSFMGMPIMAGADLCGVSQSDPVAESGMACDLALHSASARPRRAWPGDATGQRRGIGGTVGEVRRRPWRSALGVGACDGTAARRFTRFGRRDQHSPKARFAFMRAKPWYSPRVVSPMTSSDARRLFPRTPTGHEHWALPPLAVNGDGLRLGESVGARVNTDVASPVAWAPVSQVQHSDGSTGHFPHIIERGKPGIIGVLRNGQRFVNEANGYYDYVSAMVAAAPEGEEVASWLICTRAFQRRYGLGISRPFPLPVSEFIRSGYLKTGNTVEELALACGIDPSGLRQTVDNYNQHARHGEDPLFGRGATPYNRKQGDPENLPNPCVAPIDTGPFYAVKVQPGCFGTFAGLKVNPHAQVLGRPRTAHRRPLRSGRRHGQHHGRPLPGGRYQHRPGADFRLHRRPAHCRHDCFRTGDRPCSTSLIRKV